MSVVQECALVEQAIRRARYVVAPHACPPEVVAFGDMDGAARATSETTRMTASSSGAVIAVHRRFAVDNAAMLTAAGHTDESLHAQMATAASVARAGADRLEAIATRAQATIGADAGATSPAAQRAVLAALRSQLAQAADVVDSVRQQGADLAARVRALQYGPPSAPTTREPTLPSGPIVWCLRPEGTFGRYRCSILYPDLRVGTYWSPSDDTGGSTP